MTPQEKRKEAAKRGIRLLQDVLEQSRRYGAAAPFMAGVERRWRNFRKCRWKGLSNLFLLGTLLECWEIEQWHT